MSIEYSQDGTVLLRAVLSPDETIVHVHEGCQVIAEKAFMYQKDLQEVYLPSTLERIGDFAFSCTSLTRFDAPPLLRKIGKKAFYQCKDLAISKLNEGLERIGEEAFSFSGILQLAIPSTVNFIGRFAVINTPLAQHECAIGFTIHPGNKWYIRDDQGGLYRLSRMGNIFYELLSQTREEHRILPNTRYLGQKAYYRNAVLKSVRIPEGVVEIGQRAFDYATMLERVDIPETLERIGRLAFRYTLLKRFHVPSRLRKLGEGALLTGKRGETTLIEVTVSPQNIYFYTQNGFLIQRARERQDPNEDMLGMQRLDGHILAGKDQQLRDSLVEMQTKHMDVYQEQAIVYYGQARIVVVPESVKTIAYNCFAAPHVIEELYLHRGLTEVHPFAIAPDCMVKTVIIQLKEPVCGSNTAVVPFIENNIICPTTYSLFPKGSVNAAYLFEKSDRVTYFSYKTYERSKAMLNRLDCPQFLLRTYREFFIDMLTRGLMESSIEFANHEYLKGFNQLRVHGFITGDNIGDVIDAVRESGNVVVIGHLLQMRREYFQMNDLQEDFAL